MVLVKAWDMALGVELALPSVGDCNILAHHYSLSTHCSSYLPLNNQRCNLDQQALQR